MTGIGQHLCVVLTAPQEDGAVWVATFSSWTHSKDQACVVDHSEYAVLTRRSVVMYRYARRMPAKFLMTHGRKQPDISAQLLNRVFEGAKVTDEIPLDCLKAMEEQGLLGEPDFGEA